jgi:hypothetical protein
VKIDPKNHKTWPYDLQRAIGEEHRSIGESNACDHRPTYQSQLDGVTESMVAEYKAWMTLLASLSEEEIARCKRYWDQTRKPKCWGLNTDLRSTRLAAGWVLCPRWATVLDEVRKLREVLA